VAVGIVGTSISTLATNLCVAVGVIVLVAAELLARRRGLPVVWNGAALGLAGLALVAWTAGTSDSPLCEPQSWLQAHAVWHVLSALVVWVWVARTAAVDRRPAIGAD
jgi:drug/metabolite transporter (DMT)-like permease